MTKRGKYWGDDRIKTAMILAAGYGTRMLGLTQKVPKPLIKVDSVPLIDHVINRLLEGGTERLVVNLHYLGKQIEDHLKRRQSPKIFFSWEKDSPLETGGGVKLALPKIGKVPFWVINSDSIWLNGPTAMMQRMEQIWDSKKMDVLLLLQSTVDSHGYEGPGDFNLDPEGRVSRRREGEVSPWLFTGIQIVNPKVFLKIPELSFSLNLVFDEAIKNKRLFGIVHDGEWFHVGTPEGLEEVEEYMKTPFASHKRR